MLQLVGSFNKLEQQVQLVKSVVKVVIGKRGKWFEYKVGRMIKVQRDALKAGKLAEVAEFLFDTNDLTRMMFGYCATTRSPRSCSTACWRRSRSRRWTRRARWRV
ncbi:hypothetical protein PF008_g31950 [Phytophthora fragariae]|uniref:PEP-utilising enzyme C-terminal domain-containing protein n=1 Tax=Phytophthora fragariae TaxID=53985 RepID=A0A6G0Q1Q3_9STRA|nr:hypothetical protein PF008_g31950 [Phytophthora fragariae]